MAAWVTTEEADAYYATRLYADRVWTSTAPKAAALTTAQADLEYCGLFSFPDTPSDAMKRMVYEQALFRLSDPDADLRANIRAQGVKKAGIVQEEYDGAATGFPIAPAVLALGRTYKQDSPIAGAFIPLDTEVETL